MKTTLIGEQVQSLRNKCTGHAPVHFFQKVAVAAAGLALVALVIVIVTGPLSSGLVVWLTAPSRNACAAMP